MLRATLSALVLALPLASVPAAATASPAWDRPTCAPPAAARSLRHGDALRAAGARADAVTAYLRAESLSAACPGRSAAVLGYVATARAAVVSAALSEHDAGWRSAASAYLASARALRSTLAPTGAADRAAVAREDAELAAARSTGSEPVVVTDVRGTPCEASAIASVSADGAVVALLDGRRYLVRDLDRFRTRLWLRSAGVTVCDDGPPVGTLLAYGRDRVRVGRL